MTELRDLILVELPGLAWRPAKLADAIRAVLEMHRPFTVYWDCGHDHGHAHEDGDCAGLIQRLDGLWVCSTAERETICRHCCCTDGGGQSDACAADHDHVSGGPCPTVRVIAQELGLIAAVET